MIERQNYLKTRKHLVYLEEVLQLAPASLERCRFYLRHLLLWAGSQDFKQAQTIRPTLPAYLAAQPGKNGKGSLAGVTQKKILDTAKRFFHWSKTTYPRELQNLPLTWVDTLRLPRQARPIVENIFVSEEEVKQLISLPSDLDNLALLRDQAAAALLFLSGMRGGALVTLPISAIDLENLTVRQWPELGVHTKNSKRATTFLLNRTELLAPVRRWDDLVRAGLPASAPWYAPIQSNWGEQHISDETPGKCRLTALEKRLRLLFGLANLPFKSPHKFRHGHAVFGLLHAQTMADYKAVSMNLMHDSIEITDSTYAPMLSSDVQMRIAEMSGRTVSTPEMNSPSGSELETYINGLGKESLGRALVYIAGKLTQ